MSMQITGSEFDHKMSNWKREQALPWGRLKYQVVQANLEKHMGPGPMRILDAGGGNGTDSIPLARKGNPVDVVDFSAEMLSDLREQLAGEGLEGRVSGHLVELGELGRLFPESSFDLVLCHNVFQYIQDVSGLLESLFRLLKPGGMISVVSVNRYSSPYLSAFLDGDLEEACDVLGGHAYQARIFDLPMKTYCAAEMMEIMGEAGFTMEADYGIRCLCDYWGDNQRKSDPVIFEKIERIELALTGMHPYKLLGRYFQIIGRKAAP
jgi:S-adenosylmethionine-dependent methyltransferase